MLKRKRSVSNNPQQIKRKVWSLVKWIECGIYNKMKKTRRGCRLIKNRPKVKMRRSLKLMVQSGSRGGTRSAVKVSPIESAMITKSMICFSSQEKFSKRDLLQVSRLESVNRGKVMKDRLDPAEVKGSQTKIKRFLKSDLLTQGLKMCWHLSIWATSTTCLGQWTKTTLYVETKSAISSQKYRKTLKFQSLKSSAKMKTRRLILLLKSRILRDSITQKSQITLRQQPK